MEKIKYPLLHFELNNDAILGILVGTSYQVIDKDLKSVKATLSAHLQKQYKKFDDYPYANIISPKLRIVNIDIRPTYKENKGSFPLPTTLKVPIITVFGETKGGFYECHLPIFDQSFYYNNPKEFSTLLKYFATNLLNQLTPEQIYQHLSYGKPKLDTIILKINTARDFDYNWEDERDFETLERLAEKYPYSRAVARHISAFPEAAWELEDKVSDVVERLINVRANLLLVGNSGVGKSSVLKQAIKKITTKNKKQKLDFTFWQIMPQRITASAKYLGEWQEACETLVSELESANGILWVVDFIQLMLIGGEGPEDSVASFLSSFLQQGKLQLVGEVSPSELESMRRMLPGFVEQFQIIKIDELPEDKIQKILDKIAQYSKQNLKVEIDHSALEITYRLLLRYYPYERFPGKAIKFLGQCLNEAQLNQVKKVDKKAVLTNFINQTGLPELFLRDDLLLDNAELQNYFNRKIIGQPTAIAQMSSIVKIFKAGLNNPHKPISTLIFAGPTGVGKTASAKALADYFFGKGQKRSPLIRIDMSEFQHPGQIVRFIGSGREVGKLVQEIRERPFSVLLLDEVEKADPSIFDALMTVLDEGMLVDAYGRVTNFRNTIIIMTTNLGASNRKSIGFSNDTTDEAAYLSAISSYFRPEFVNRIDGVVMFNSLIKEDVKKITNKELDDLKQREGFVKRGLKIKFTNRLVDEISEAGFDERYGARPLQRAIEQLVVAPLAKWLLNHNAENCILNVDFVEGMIEVNQKKK